MGCRLFEFCPGYFAFGFEGSLVFPAFIPSPFATVIIASLGESTTMLFLVTAASAVALVGTLASASALRVGVEGLAVLCNFLTFATFVVSEHFKECAGDIGRRVA